MENSLYIDKKENKCDNIIKFFKRILNFIIKNPLEILLIGFFIFRMLQYTEIYPYSYLGLSSIDNGLNLKSFAETYYVSKGMAFITMIAVWFEYLAVLVVIMRKFFNIKSIGFITRFITIFIFITNLIFLNQIMNLFNGFDINGKLYYSYLGEVCLGIALSIIWFIKDFKVKYSLKEVFMAIGIFFALLIPCMPAYTHQFIFGLGNNQYKILDLHFEHRIMLYLAIIIPVTLYFLLRNRSQEVIRFSLIYISVATMCVFSIEYSFDYLFETGPHGLENLNHWPLHLCNTAMFVIPICLIFRTKKLFYFTYFINVFGALLAMLMPNYSETNNIIAPSVIRFWYNHWIAFFMPLLIVALKEFKRPEKKQFKYSMIGFFIYYLLVLFLNTLLTAQGKDCDFFFINSTFIAEKMPGKWAENLFNQTLTIKSFGYHLVFHPGYQLVYFAVYVGLALAIWFVYAEFFIIADKHYELHIKLHKIKLHKLAYKARIPERKIKEMEERQNEVILEIKNLTKRYASSNVYAVKDASFSVHGGEIFGFLGPNGAGKSTIIKSIVGIQTVTGGKINVCGYSAIDEPVEAKYNIGYVPDHYALYEKLTGREYINYIADIYNVSMDDRNSRIEKYVKLFELSHAIDNKIQTYSHGMKQKITIMAALVHNPKVWILDEPLTGLDPTSIYQVKECMKQHAQEGNIVFFSSHLIDIVEKLCGRIAIIKKGQIQCVKTVDEIENSNTTLEEFYMSIIGNTDEQR